MKELIKNLCSVDGISGYEQPVAARIRELVAPYAEKIETDVLGNLYVLKKGEKTPEAPVAVATGMAEHGFVISDDEGSEGAVKLIQMDEMDVRNVIGRRFHVVRTGVKGVISLVAQHLAGNTDSVPMFKEVQFDFGGVKKEDAEGRVQPGDTLVFDYPVQEFGENCLRGKALDCRVGCAILVKLIQEVTPAYDTWFIFTAAKNLEHRGAVIAARHIDPAVLLMVEGCACCDVPMQKKERISAYLRKGAAIGLKERRILFSRRLNDQLIAQAEREHVAWQYRTSVSDTSDAGTLQISASGCEVASIGVPVRGMSAANPVAYIPDIEAAYALAQLFVKEGKYHDESH